MRRFSCNTYIFVSVRNIDIEQRVTCYALCLLSVFNQLNGTAFTQ